MSTKESPLREAAIETVPAQKHAVVTRARIRSLVQDGSLIVVLIALLILVGASKPEFLAPQNLLNVLQQWAPVGIMATAVTLVLIAGASDFSVGGTYVLAGVVFAFMANRVPIGLALVIGLASGIAIGLINALVVTKARVDPFIGTLGVGQAAVGLGLVITGGAPIVASVAGFDLLGSGMIGPLALSSIILVLFMVATGWLLYRSIYGRKLYAIGGNAEASRLSGIRVERLLTSTFVISGCAAALAGMITASRLGSGQAATGFNLGFDVFTAVVLGGTAIGGGVGAIWRTAVGVALLATMQNGLDSLGVNSFYQTLIKGVVLVLAVAWDQYVQRSRRKNVGV